MLTWLAYISLSILPSGEKDDWAEGLSGSGNGATRDYYNRAGLLAWNNFMGDWRDANDVAQGKQPYAVATIADTDQARFIEWNVTDLVREWTNGKRRNQGFFLRTTKPSGIVLFASRQFEQSKHHPRLVISTGGRTTSFAAVADTNLNTSTYRSLGQSTELRVSSTPDHTLIRFDLSPLTGQSRVTNARLLLYSTRQYDPVTVGVFRCSQGHVALASKPITGIASQFQTDQGIATDSRVLFATDFESSEWSKEWDRAGNMDVIDTVAEDPARKFRPLSGRALRVRIAKGATGALNTLFKTKTETGHEPEEIYFRYYLRLGDDWKQTIGGGKLPGVSGTYGIAGWGGRKSNGTNGWSARGLFKRTIPKGNPLADTTPIGTYCYHADMKGTYGDDWVWQNGYRGFLKTNRWYSVEQFVKLNSPGQRDGIIRAWIDGRPAFEKTDIQFRKTDTLKIEQIWMNVYHGGTDPSPYDQHVFIDNVVIAREYIGPINRH